MLAGELGMVDCGGYFCAAFVDDSRFDVESAHPFCCMSPAGTAPTMRTSIWEVLAGDSPMVMAVELL